MWYSLDMFIEGLDLIDWVMIALCLVVVFSAGALFFDHTREEDDDGDLY